MPKKIELTMDEIRRLVNQIEEAELSGISRIIKLTWDTDQLLPLLTWDVNNNSYEEEVSHEITRNVFLRYYGYLIEQYPEHKHQFKYWDFSL